MNELPGKDLVLVGAGHTNLHVMRMWREHPIADTRLTVVSAFSRATYSGMLPGTLAGLYTADEMEIDLYRLTVGTDIRLIIDRATSVSARQRRVYFAERPGLKFDVASIGVGSRPQMLEHTVEHPRVLSIKPMATFLRRFENALNHCMTTTVNLVVVGGGAAGVEIAFCSRALLRNRGVPVKVTLVDRGHSILRGYRPKTIRLAERELANREIAVQATSPVSRLTNDAVILESGKSIPADIVIWSPGAAPPELAASIDLPLSESGFIAVEKTLRTPTNDPVFVVGDTAEIIGENIPRAGVYAVREGPVLWDNVRRELRGDSLIEFHPQSGFLSLLATGDGRAIGEYRGVSGYGRTLWKIKNHIDVRFMNMHRPEAMRGEMPAAEVTTTKTGSRTPAMQCAGCGGKTGGAVLDDVMRRLRADFGGTVGKGFLQPEDAAILPQPAEVASVDFFSAFMDDPWTVGRVAALNALSDLWATGAAPTSAVAMVTLPDGPTAQQAELLYHVLAGGIRELSAAGATLVGGHTIRGAELTVGFTVLGAMNGRQPFRKSGLVSEDRLLLTQPLGTGVLLAALASGQSKGAWMDSLMTAMLRGNKEAAEVANRHQLRGVTDITGFGLAGHLVEMLQASGVSAELNMSAIPLFDGAAELLDAGLRSTLDPANRQVEYLIRADPDSLRTLAVYHALFDPQTSGGLLLGVPADRCDAVLADLKAHGDPRRCVIGKIISDPGQPGVVYTKQ